MTPLERLRYKGLTVRFDCDKAKLMIGPKHLLAKWTDYIVENRDQIIADLDQEQKEAALAKLPFAEFQAGPVEMMEVVLLKMFDGEYLALTPEEVLTLDGFAAVAKNDSGNGKNTAGPTVSMNAGIDCSASFQVSHTPKELF